MPGSLLKPGELSTISPKTLGQSASDFEDIPEEELEGYGLPPGMKGFGVPALYKAARSYLDGLRPGDVILSLDGRSFESTKNLNNYIQTKKEFEIGIKFLRGGKIYTMNTMLHSESDLQRECKTIEDLQEIADFGEPYALLRARRSLLKTQWDFLGWDNLQTARKMTQAHQHPLLVGLFGSSVCCVHLAPWADPYKDLITNASIQKTIAEHYVSLLVLKPEAYLLYRQYHIDSRFPALLRMTNEDELEAHLSLGPHTRVSDVLSFSRKRRPNRNIARTFGSQ